MAEFSIFYSWQSDLPRKLSREVIQYAAAKSIERLSLDASIEDSPRLDHDTKDVSGAPEIAQTIFSKIDQCGIFLADLTFVGSTLPSDGNKPTKKIPNPNVLLELGYAAAKIGWDRIVLVMNSAYGTPDELIFDLRQRRFPLTFFLSPDTRKDVESVTNSLADKLEEAFRSSMQSEHMAVQNAISRLDQHGLQWMSATGMHDYFAPPCRNTMGEMLGNQRLDDGLIRLIDLQLLRCEVAAGKNLYAYHWTYLGKLVLRKLRFRSQ